jgi:hypothetical protein
MYVFVAETSDEYLGVGVIKITSIFRTIVL